MSVPHAHATHHSETPLLQNVHDAHSTGAADAAPPGDVTQVLTRLEHLEKLEELTQRHAACSSVPAHWGQACTPLSALPSSHSQQQPTDQPLRACDLFQAAPQPPLYSVASPADPTESASRWVPLDGCSAGAASPAKPASGSALRQDTQNCSQRTSAAATGNGTPSAAACMVSKRSGSPNACVRLPAGTPEEALNQNEQDTVVSSGRALEILAQMRERPGTGMKAARSSSQGSPQHMKADSSGANGPQRARSQPAPPLTAQPSALDQGPQSSLQDCQLRCQRTAGCTKPARHAGFCQLYELTPSSQKSQQRRTSDQRSRSCSKRTSDCQTKVPDMVLSACKQAAVTVGAIIPEAAATAAACHKHGKTNPDFVMERAQGTDSEATWSDGDDQSPMPAAAARRRKQVQAPVARSKSAGDAQRSMHALAALAGAALQDLGASQRHGKRLAAWQDMRSSSQPPDPVPVHGEQQGSVHVSATSEHGMVINAGLRSALRQSEQVCCLKPQLLQAIQQSADMNVRMHEAEIARDAKLQTQVAALQVATAKASETAQLQVGLHKELAVQRKLNEELTKAERELRASLSSSVQLVRRTCLLRCGAPALCFSCAQGHCFCNTSAMPQFMFLGIKCCWR
jgi:hypothetical protein